NGRSEGNYLNNTYHDRWHHFPHTPSGRACFYAMRRYSSLIWNTKLRFSCLASRKNRRRRGPDEMATDPSPQQQSLAVQFVRADVDCRRQVQRFDGTTARTRERPRVEGGQLLAGHAAGLVAEQVAIEGSEAGRLQAVAIHVQTGDALEA